MADPLYERPVPDFPAPTRRTWSRAEIGKLSACGTAHSQRAAFYFDDTRRESDYCQHLTTVGDIKERSGLNCFHELAGPVQNALEAGRSGAGARMRP